MCLEPFQVSNSLHVKSLHHVQNHENLVLTSPADFAV